jgi:hypothetical protein
MTYAQLKSHWIPRKFKRISLFSSGIFHHSYFIVNDVESVIIVVVEWFSPKYCNEVHFKILNSFNKKSMKWMSKLQSHEKFQQYYGCKLVFMLPIPHSTGENYHLSGYAKFYKNNTEFEAKGIVPILFQITAKLHNFTAVYQPTATSTTDMTYMFKYKLEFVHVNGVIYIPDVFFQIQPFSQGSSYIRTTLPVTDTQLYIFMTPAEAYTPYEKLFLPFDIETWALLAFTFGITVLVIFVTNLLSKTTRQLVYGQKIDNPFWNVVSIFFGISQTRLPIETFPRLILTYFVIFCLIFRTCYQNKLFQYMTSEPRRAPPKTIEDIIDRNYIVYSAVKNLILKSVDDGRGRRYVWGLSHIS